MHVMRPPTRMELGRMITARHETEQEFAVSCRSDAVYRSILVAVDQPHATAAAIGVAAQTARRSRGRLTLLASYKAFRITPVFPPALLPVFPSEDELAAAATRRVDRALELVDETIPAAGMIRPGDLNSALIARAACGEHDLIVVGTTNLSYRLSRR